ncbi:MAG: DUF2309 domain-containing protein [Planctomycetales bacterium]|nr:DUF2309 domain-containing protein [Planctomycetales bacterium]
MTSPTHDPADRDGDVDFEHLIAHLAHLLPSQGPISVFVHHNTLHAFEEQSFHEAVQTAADLYDCHPYLPEPDYRVALKRGRITQQDLEAELYDVLGDEGDRLLGRLGTRHELWMSMLEHPLREGTEAEIRWFIDETEALYRFRPEASDAAREQTIDDTRRWLVRDYFNGIVISPARRQRIDALINQFGGRGAVDSWDDPTWEAFSLHLLWLACEDGATVAEVSSPACEDRHWAQANELVDAAMIRLCAAFLDQGFAPWILPERDRGLLQAFLALHQDALPADSWLARFPARAREIRQQGVAASQLIEQSLVELQIPPAQYEQRLQEQLLSLRGWAGTLWQMETNAEWAPWPAPPGSLVEYVAVRLLLLREAVAAVRRSDATSPATVRETQRQHQANLAFVLFQIAEIRGWSGAELLRQSRDEWMLLTDEATAFPSRMRRRVYHLAYERHYREQSLGAIQQAAARPDPPAGEPAYQVVCCIDDREESFRRHLEEVDPACETLGFAGFFGVAMYYRGLGETHFRPLCPVNVKPRHYIVEEPVYTEATASRRRAAARKALGRAAQGVTFGSRSVLGGLVTGLLGAIATAPLVLRVVAPRLADVLLRGAGRMVRDRRTRLHLETTAPPADGRRDGYTVDEMAAIVGGMLRTTGLPAKWSPLVIICGHGSSSLNNPHAAAYDCGACGGGRGGPNARAFARMANDPRVRAILSERGIAVPPTTVFVGAYHNTCDDSVVYYDLDSLQSGADAAMSRAREAIDEARRRDAHERSRRFESADLNATPERALRHVEGRAADLSQVRSECGHATNALCLVGRRQWSRDLFLDRRAFLTSYDPVFDDEEHSVLANLLAAVIPVCAGINLEYYFSRIDNVGYGCGTKLPHNLTSLLGVVDGAGSDLRTGLPWQMVEIHEPLRILFIIETTAAALKKIMAANPAIERLVVGEWVQLAIIDPAHATIQLYRRGEFVPFESHDAPLPTASASAAWYRGQRDHLGFALIDAAKGHASSGGPR